MIPENPVVGGTVLRRAAIQSPNFATGVSGWSINQDGSAEFNNVVIRNGQVVSGTALFYSGLPAFGNLVASIAAAGGTDSKGNVYLEGVTSYFKVPPGTSFLASQIDAGSVVFWSAPGAGGPWTLNEQMKYNTLTGNLDIGAPGAPALSTGDGATGNTVDVNLLLRAFLGLQVTASGTDRVHLSNSTGSDGGLMLVQNTLANPGGNPTVFRAASAGDKVLAVDVAGDASKRLRIDSDGELNWGGGVNAPDAFLIYFSPGNLASSYIAYTPSESAGVVEQWNAVTFVNGWANAASGAGMQYKRCAAPDNTVELVGRLTAPAGIAGNQTIFTLPALYRPLSLQGVIGINVTTGAVVRFTMTNGGVFQYQSGAAAGNTIDVPAGSLVSLLA